MDEKKDKLIPSDDLGDFYKNKISTCLTIIYNYTHQTNNKGLVLRDINIELDEIFKMIKYRLEDNEYKELSTKYENYNKRISKLRPFKRTFAKDNETGDRIKKVVGTSHYPIYKETIKDKEVLIWECLDKLGLLGKITKDGVNLR